MSLLLLAALLSAQPVVEASAPQADAPVAAPAKPQKEKKICRSDPDTTGSHMVKRTCLTAREWQSRVEGRTVDEMNAAPVSH